MLDDTIPLARAIIYSKKLNFKIYVFGEIIFVIRQNINVKKNYYL